MRTATLRSLTRNTCCRTLLDDAAEFSLVVAAQSEYFFTVVRRELVLLLEKNPSFVIRVQKSQMLANRVLKQLDGRAASLQNPLQPLGHLLHGQKVNLVEQLFFGLEVVVDARLGDVQLGRDLIQRGCVKPFTVKSLRGRANDELPLAAETRALLG